MAETSSETDFRSSRPMPPSLSTKSLTRWLAPSRLISTSASSKPRDAVTLSATALTLSTMLSCPTAPSVPKKRVGRTHSGATPGAGNGSIAGVWNARKGIRKSGIPLDDPGHQVVGVGLRDLASHEGTGLCGPVRDQDLAVDLGPLGGRTAAQDEIGIRVASLHEDFDPLPDQVRVPARRDPLLQRQQAPPPRLFRARRNAVREVERRRPFLVREREHTDVVEVGRLHEVQELLEVRFRL